MITITLASAVALLPAQQITKNIEALKRFMGAPSTTVTARAAAGGPSADRCRSPRNDHRQQVGLWAARLARIVGVARCHGVPLRLVGAVIFPQSAIAVLSPQDLALRITVNAGRGKLRMVPTLQVHDAIEVVHLAQFLSRQSSSQSQMDSCKQE
jgi:hypothetical protein